MDTLERAIEGDRCEARLALRISSSAGELHENEHRCRVVCSARLEAGEREPVAAARIQ